MVGDIFDAAGLKLFLNNFKSDILSDAIEES